LINLHLPWKTELSWIRCFEYTFCIQGFWVTCAYPEKQSCPENFHYFEYTFYISDFWATSACPEKQRVPWKFSLYWIYILSFRIFEQLALALKNSCPENFHCTEYTFHIQDLWVTCACPEKQLPWNFSLYWNIFYHSGFLSKSRLPWRTELPCNFSLYWIYFLHSGFLSNLRLPWKTEFPCIVVPVWWTNVVFPVVGTDVKVWGVSYPA